MLLRLDDDDVAAKGGFAAELVENGGDEANVVFPGGEMARVNLSEVASQSPRSISYVPVGS